MPTAWQWLTANSELPDVPGNTAWDHLTNIVGGGFWDGILKDGFDIEVDMSCLDVEVTLDLEYKVEVDMGDLDVEIDMNEYEVEICDG